MKLCLSLLFFFSLVASVRAITQESSSKATASWTVEQHCVDDTNDTGSWAFGGTILVTGDTGIYGIDSNWEMPRLVTPLTFEQKNTNLVGGGLSPDGLWYASPFGDRIITESNNVLTTVREIHVYDTSSEGSEYSITLVPPIVDIPQGFYIQIHWQDNQWILYANGEKDILVNPFTQEKRFLEGYHFNNVFDRFDYNQRPHLAPDFSLAVSAGYPYSDSQWGLYTVPAEDLFNPIPLIQLELAETSIIAWRSDSQIFAAEQEGENHRQLVFIDRAGNTKEVVFQLPEGQRIGNNNIAWSVNGRYFAFITFDDLSSQNGIYSYWGSPNTLYIADNQEHVVIDTCLSTGIGLAWSPSSIKLAFLSPGDGNQTVFVMDVENLNAYPVANYFVETMGVGENYRPNSVIGWRISRGKAYPL